MKLAGQILFMASINLIIVACANPVPVTPDPIPSSPVPTLVPTPTPVPYRTSSFNVVAGGKQALEFDLPTSGQIEYVFRVTSGGDLDIDFSVLDPGGNTIRRLGRATSDEGNAIAEMGGRYSLVFSNDFSLLTNKRVEVTYRALPDGTLANLSTTARPQPLTASIVLTDAFQFVPSRLAAKVGQEITITLRNEGATAHSFVITALNVNSGYIQGGKSATVKFTPATAGTYEFRCDIPGHTEAGMRGTISVS